jgi:hypothetical protein
MKAKYFKYEFYKSHTTIKLKILINKRLSIHLY